MAGIVDGLMVWLSGSGIRVLILLRFYAQFCS